MKLMLLVLVSNVLFSCVSLETKREHSQLSEMRLVPRHGYKGMLTNRICSVEHKVTRECKSWSVKSFDIRDKHVRVMLNEFRFACRLGGKRFRISLAQPGFIHKDKVCTKETMFGNCKKWQDNSRFISIDQYEYLIEGHLECWRGW